MLKVQLTAITAYLEPGDVSPEALIEHAGRVCYQSKNKGVAPEQIVDRRARFIQARIEAGHESIVEHASATFEISGISRAASHQLVRHRVASYSQESQRYVDMSDARFVIPPDIEWGTDEVFDLWIDTMRCVRRAYHRLRELGIKKQDARFLLPNATATRIVVTMNFRELLHVFRVRISPGAQWEIRRMCVEMLRLIEPRAPNVFDALKEQLERDYPEFFEADNGN